MIGVVLGKGGHEISRWVALQEIPVVEQEHTAARLGANVRDVLHQRDQPRPLGGFFGEIIEWQQLHIQIGRFQNVDTCRRERGRDFCYNAATAGIMGMTMLIEQKFVLTSRPWHLCAMKHAETVTFGGSGLDRAAHLRPQAATLRGEKNAVTIVMWRGKILVDDADQLLRLPVTHKVSADVAADKIFLGLEDNVPIFASDISTWMPEGFDPAEAFSFFDKTRQVHPACANGGFADIRATMTALSPRDAELAATAKAVMEWHRSHRFCAKCGHESVMAMGGWQRDCPGCGAHHFPRTDPVVIMLITRGNSVLMGRSPGWPEGMYSLLAGFVEPGETIEAAVRREVFEESGVRVGAVSYLSSQPWPFPASLMFGCRGEALTDDIVIDPAEIEDALWVTREEMVDVFAGQHPKINPARAGAIAHFLLENWLSDRLD